MRALRFLPSTALAALVLTLAGATSAGEKRATNREVIVGVWRWESEWAGAWSFVRRTGPAIYEFTKGGKIRVSDEVRGKLVTWEGANEVDGNVLKAKVVARVIRLRIQALGARTMVLTEETGGRLRMRWFKRM
jgi:hypothetical protein